MPEKRERKKPTHQDKKQAETVGPTEFNKLLRFIVTFQGRFALAFICGDDRRQRQGVLASLADLLKEKGIELRQIDLAHREVTDLLHTIREECRQRPPAAIVITGIEASLKRPLLASLNIQRDLLSCEISCPLLFWVSSFALNVIAREAPDFYDFRYTVFNFKADRPREALATQTTLTKDQLIPFDQAGGSEDRTAYLLEQLAKYQKDEPQLGFREKLAYGELLEEIARGYKGERHRTEALIYLEQALNIYQEIGDKGREASVLRAMADIYYFADNQARAVESVEKALALYHELGDRLGEANALLSLGKAKRLQRAHAEAEAGQLYQEALARYRELGDRRGEANALLSLGDVHLVQDAHAEAATLYQEALALYHELGDRLGEANALLRLGRAKRLQRAHAEAVGFYQEALARYRELGDRLGEADALRGLGDVHLAQDAHAEAATLYQEALARYRELGDRRGEANILRSLGKAMREQGAYAEAATLYQEALARYRELGDRLGEAAALQGLGHVQLAQGTYAEAEKRYLSAADIYASLDDKVSQGMAILSLVDVYRGLHDARKARASARLAKALLEPFRDLVQKNESVVQQQS